MGGEASIEEKLVKNIGQHETLVLFSATVGTGVTTTGANVDVSKSSSQTIFIDFTGDDVTGVIITVRGGIQDLAMINLRQETGTWTTAAGGTQIVYKSMNAGNTTGVTAGQTGITRINDMNIQVNNPASTTGGSSVTVSAKVLTSPVF